MTRMVLELSISGNASFMASIPSFILESSGRYFVKSSLMRTKNEPTNPAAVKISITTRTAIRLSTINDDTFFSMASDLPLEQSLSLLTISIASIIIDMC